MMPTGGWHSLALHLLVNATSGTADVSLDGNPVPLSATGNFGVNPVATFELGNAGTSTSSYDIAFDDVSVAQSLLTQPTAPILSATAADSAVSLSWTTPSDGGSSITGYYIYRGTSSGAESLLTTVGPNTNAYSDTGLSNGASYYYEVAAVNSLGTGPLSTEVQATPSASAPAAPTLSGTAGNATVGLSWTTPGDGGSPITGYAIYRGTSSGGESLLTTVGVTNSYTDTSVTNGTAYYYEVAAVNGVGTGALSTEVAETPQSPPAAPTGLAANSAKGKGVQLSWAATTGATSYRVYRSTTGATGAYTLIASVTSPSYKDTSTTRGVTYYYKVTAVNTFGESPQSNSVSATAT
jgi:titin